MNEANKKERKINKTTHLKLALDLHFVLELELLLLLLKVAPKLLLLQLLLASKLRNEKSGKFPMIHGSKRIPSFMPPVEERKSNRNVSR